MEQVTLQGTTALQHEHPQFKEPSPPKFPHLRDMASRLAVASLCAVATVSGAVAANQALDRPSLPPKTSGPNYEPLADLKATSNDAETINQQIGHAYRTDGHSIDIVGPDQDAVQAFEAYFNHDASSTPRLNEIVRIQDRTLFAPELKTQPDVYPFIVYNATEHPVDIKYLDYALEATRSWLDKTVANGGETTIEGHTLLKIRPLADPHAMIMTNEMPAFMDIANSSGTDGFTHWYGDHRNTRSFILPYGSAEAPFRPVAVGTEICQAMVDVYDAKTLPGGSYQQAAMERFVAKVNPRNPAARHNSNLASKESICNGLGRVTAALYQGGETALHKLPLEVGRTGSFIRKPWIDFLVYSADLPELIQLKDDIVDSGHTAVITGKDDRSPTAGYYHQQEAGYAALIAP
jgi:hypothetical protein